MSRRKSRFLRKPVEPFAVTAGLSADDLLTRMERISFQGRNVATARRIWEKMLASDATIFMGIAGALSAGGMRLIIAHLIEHRHIDCLVSTGANATTICTRREGAGTSSDRRRWTTRRWPPNGSTACTTP